LPSAAWKIPLSYPAPDATWAHATRAANSFSSSTATAKFPAAPCCATQWIYFTSTTRIACAARSPSPAPETLLFQDVLAHARATPLGHGRDSTIFSLDQEGPVNPMSAGALYRRSVFDRIGYYDESFDACEDVEFNYRVWKAGLTVDYQPEDHRAVSAAHRVCARSLAN
jgi:hypothetical protein